MLNDVIITFLLINPILKMAYGAIGNALDIIFLDAFFCKNDRWVKKKIGPII